MPKCYCDLNYHKAGLLLVESLCLVQVSEQLTPFDELHQEINPKIVLEDIVHAHDERVFNRVEDVLLELDVFKLFVVNDDVLPDTFHGINLLSVHVLDQKYLAESALAHHLHNDEILKFDHILVFLLPGEYQVAALPHAGSGIRLVFLRAVDLLVLIFIFVVFILVGEVLALLKLLVSDL